MRHQYVEEEGRRLCVRLCVRVFETRGSKIAFHAPTNGLRLVRTTKVYLSIILFDISLKTRAL